MSSEIAERRVELKTFNSEFERQLSLMHADLVQRIIRSGEETRRQMRVLHEDLVQRITAIGQEQYTRSSFE